MRLGDTLIDRFVIEESVGRGGIGAVYRGWDLDTERAVAIKLLLHLSPSDIKRFEREAALLADARLPGIVQHVHHGCTDDGTPYLVMEWLDGKTVAKHLEDRGFDVAESIALLRAVCAPLAGLHARGIVHRDLKPENLVMTSERPEDVVLIDLGLARSTEASAGRVTATGCILGTPGYMSPEQVRGMGTVDARSDVFALGCVLYECLTGYAAFAGDNFFAVRAKVLLATPPSLRSLCPEAPAALVDLVGAMLAKDPADRPRDAGDAGERLSQILQVDVSQRRRWHTAQADTFVVGDGGGIPRPPATIAMDRWNAIVLVRAADTAALDLVAVPDARIERVDGGFLVAIVADGLDRETVARAAIRLAVALEQQLPEALQLVTTATGALEDLIDRASRMLDAHTRAALVASGATVPVAQILVDESLADLRASGMIVYKGPR